MTTVATDHIPGFHQSSVEQLALGNPFEEPRRRSTADVGERPRARGNPSCEGGPFEQRM
jgi:hypothetical protein